MKKASMAAVVVLFVGTAAFARGGRAGADAQWENRIERHVAEEAAQTQGLQSRLIEERADRQRNRDQAQEDESKTETEAPKLSKGEALVLKKMMDEWQDYRMAECRGKKSSDWRQHSHPKDFNFGFIWKKYLEDSERKWGKKDALKQLELLDKILEKDFEESVEKGEVHPPPGKDENQEDAPSRT